MFIRASAKILFTEAEAMGLQPKWETSYGLFSFAKNSKKHFVFYTKMQTNSQLGAWLSKDKLATKIILQDTSIPLIPYCYTGQKQKVNAFLNTYKMIIKKPLEGENAQGVSLLTTYNQVRKLTNLQQYLFEQYIEGDEYRVLIVKGKVIIVQRKQLTPKAGFPWKKHITTLDVWDEKLAILAQKVARELQLGFVAGDFILDKKGAYWLLETNSAPGLYPFHYPDAGKSINVAKVLLKSIID